MQYDKTAWHNFVAKIVFRFSVACPDSIFPWEKEPQGLVKHQFIYAHMNGKHNLSLGLIDTMQLRLQPFRKHFFNISRSSIIGMSAFTS